MVEVAAIGFGVAIVFGIFMLVLGRLFPSIHGGDDWGTPH
jgi:hypothetical protein